MAYIPLEKLLSKNNSLYKLVMAGSERVTQLSQGAEPLIPVTCKKLTTLALQEIAAGKVDFKGIEDSGKKSKKSKSADA